MDALGANLRVEFIDQAIPYGYAVHQPVPEPLVPAAIEIVDKTGIGLAPGTAFGTGGELFMRACFLRDPAQIAEAADRLRRYILDR